MELLVKGIGNKGSISRESVSSTRMLTCSWFKKPRVTTSNVFGARSTELNTNSTRCLAGNDVVKTSVADVISPAIATNHPEAASTKHIFPGGKAQNQTKQTCRLQNASPLAPIAKWQLVEIFDLCMRIFLLSQVSNTESSNRLLQQIMGHHPQVYLKALFPTVPSQAQAPTSP